MLRIFFNALIVYLRYLESGQGNVTYPSHSELAVSDGNQLSFAGSIDMTANLKKLVERLNYALNIIDNQKNITKITAIGTII